MYALNAVIDDVADGAAANQLATLKEKIAAKKIGDVATLSGTKAAP